MKKFFYFFFSLTIIFSNSTFVVLAQEATPSATLSPQQEVPQQDFTQQAIQQLPDLNSTSSGVFSLEDDGISSPFPNFSNLLTNPSAAKKVFPIIRTLSKRSFKANEI